MRFKILLPLIFLLSAFLTKAQMPALKVDGKESSKVYLEKLEVAVKVTGNIAATTWTMTFRNTTSRILEGELTFPLGEGLTVSRYALDINGRLREAVPVNRARATAVLEAMETRRIDPGLLEKIDGNSFRTRIYPINPGMTRTVLIGYEEVLPYVAGNKIRYRLPLALSYTVDTVSFQINVSKGGAQPQMEDGSLRGLDFREGKHAYVAKQTFLGYKTTRPIAFTIGQDGEDGTALVQESGYYYYYLINTPPQKESRSKALPDSISVAWDASLSSRFRRRDAELDILDRYFRKLRNVQVNAIVFSNEIRQTKRFTVTDGHWETLRSMLEQATPDGATNLGALSPALLSGKEVLLFSDGKSTWGKGAFPAGSKPVYCIASSVQTDYPALRYIAQSSGGAFIDLSLQEGKAALSVLTTQPLMLLGIRKSKDLGEVYPSIATSAAAGNTLAGVSYMETGEVTLLYGYGREITMEKKVRLSALDKESGGLSIQHIWAQKKLEELDLNYELHKKSIEQIGRQYGLLTRTTSLIVLENLADYLQYRIEPPEELLDAYRAATRSKGEQQAAEQKNRVARATASVAGLTAWWKKEVIVRAPRYQAPIVDFKSSSSSTRISEQLERAPMTNQADMAALTTQSHQIRNGASLSLGGGRSSNTTYVVDGVQLAPGNAGFVYQPKGTVDHFSDDESGTPARYGSVDGGIASFDTVTGVEQGNKTTAAHFGYDTSLMGMMQHLAPEDQYPRYLQLRKQRMVAPAFYFNMGAFFINAGRKDIGLRILSNLAELDMENYELYKMLGYKLKQAGETAEAVNACRKVAEWRPMDPQSTRDYALALADDGQYQAALDTLYSTLANPAEETTESNNEGIEEILVTEINNLIALHPALDRSRIDAALIKPLPVDIRVVINWNMKNTDIDLWVTDPNGEKCFYGHNQTKIGGRISKDFTTGFGPEQFILRKAIPGTYKIEVNYYGDRQVKIAGPTTVMAEVYTR